MTVGLGFKTYLGFGEETVYGTAVTRTKYLEINSETLLKKVDRIMSRSLLHRGVHKNRVVAGSTNVGGTIEFDAQYGSWERLLKHLMGTVVTNQPDPTGAATGYQHTFTIADSLPTGLTMEIFRDTSGFPAADQNKASVYAGCKVMSATFGITLEDLLRVSMEIVGQQETQSAKSTPTYLTDELAVFTQGSLKWNGNSIDVSDAEITINNNLEDDRRYIGAGTIKEPLPAEKILVEGRFTTDFENYNLANDFFNTTQRRMILLFDGPTITGSLKKSITFDVPVALIMDFDNAVDSHGRIRSEVSFQGYRDDTNNEVIAKIVNTASSV